MFCVLALVYSCSQSKPEIATAELRLVYRQGTAAPGESFSLFALVQDGDGIADLSELYLIHDRSQLSWKLSSSDWIRVERSGQQWIGGHGLAMPDAEDPLPRGGFRLIAVDQGGERHERTLAFDAPTVPSFDFPSLSLGKTSYEIRSSYPRNSFVLYDAQGALLQTVPIPYPSGPIASLNLPPAARAVALWAEDPDSSVAALTKTQTLP